MTNMYRESPVFNLQYWAIDYYKVHLRCKYYSDYTKACNCYIFTLLDLYLLDKCKLIDVSILASEKYTYNM